MGFTANGDLIQMVDGIGLQMAGIGILMNHLVGLRIIMAVGTMMIITDGFGYPIMTGHLHGLNGVMMMTISVGRRFLHMQILKSISESIFL